LLYWWRERGSYDVVLTNPAGTATSNAVALRVETPPVITTGPKAATVTVGQPFALSVAATDAGTIGYQWRRGGVAIVGATSPNYAVAAAQVGDAGSYDCVLTGLKGSATTVAVVVGVNRPVAPSITVQPASAGLPKEAATR
jgi:hypothetical protein